MPNLDGIEMLIRLRADAAWPSLIVILTTAAEVAPAVRALADGVLMKPFSAEDFIRTLHTCISQRAGQPLWEAERRRFAIPSEPGLATLGLGVT